MTHDVMTNFGFFNELNFDYKMIQIYRNPYDMIFSWYKRGFGNRYNSDPSSFDILLKYKNILCPYYVAGSEKKWIKMNLSIEEKRETKSFNLICRELYKDSRPSANRLFLCLRICFSECCWSYLSACNAVFVSGSLFFFLLLYDVV